MNEYIIDTNVPLLAHNLDNTIFSAACIKECVIWLARLFDGQVQLVIDNRYIILQEYMGKMQTLNDGLGNKFLKWVLSNQANTRCVKQIQLTPLDIQRTEFKEFPAALRDTGIDPSDKKFIAVAAANCGRAPIVEASDSKWIGWETSLNAAGIKVLFPCRSELEQLHRKKISG